ncbi:MAG: signal peptidase I [Mogibacterium sp.]|nr:signal peptidase I [Mogibacterium sp.]
MIRTSGILNGAEVSRVKRNQAIYLENEQYEEAEAAGTKERNVRSRLLGRLVIACGIFMMLFVVAACLTIIGPKIAGYDSHVVVSGSMEPTIPVGSIVYSKKEDPALLRVGDVIVFINESRGTTPITHRIVTNNPATRIITTKGDNNEKKDADVVTYDNVLGKVVAHVERIGMTAAMFTTKIGKIVASLLLLEGWLLTEIGRRMKYRKM